MAGYDPLLQGQQEEGPDGGNGVAVAPGDGDGDREDGSVVPNKADASTKQDSGADAATNRLDAGMDAEVDAGMDAEVDAGDAGMDAEVDAGDAGMDAEVDAGDAGMDAAMDAGMDAEVDAGDAGKDAGTPVTYRRTLIVDNGDLPASCVSDLSDFPFLLNVMDPRLRSRTYGGEVASDLGDDIRFSNASTLTEYPHELESYDPKNGTLVAWVKLPTLSANNAPLFHMHYGDDSGGPSEDPNGVWDDGYRGVYHLHDDHADSTGHDNHGSNQGTEQSDGTVAGGAAFADDNDRIPLGNSTSFDGLFDSGGTLSAWIRADGWGDSARGRIFDRSEPGQGWFFFVRGNGLFIEDLRFGMTFSGNVGYWDTPMSLDSWMHVAVTYNASSTSNNPTIYINGVPATLYENGSPSGVRSDVSGTPVALGNRAYELTRAWDGVLDEARLSAVTRSRCWIETSYLNQRGSVDLLIVDTLPGPTPP